MRNLRKNLVAFIMFAGFAFQVVAQEKASVAWNCTQADSNAVSTTEGSAAGLPITGKNIFIRDYTGTLSGGGGGPLGSFQRWYINANWPDEKVQNSNRYIQFAAVPKAGYTFNLSSMAFIMCAKSTSGMKVNLYISLDSTFSTSTLINTAGAISLSPDAAQEFSYTVNIPVPDGKTFYFRIYPWLPGGSANTGKYVMLQKVVFSGVTAPSGTTLPLTVITKSVTQIASTSAASGGNITSDGGKLVTERGICWNTSSSPNLSHFKTSEGTGTGLFVSLLTGLMPKTTYYVRAYATHADGTVYGDEVSFTTLAPPILAFPGAEGYGRYTTGGRGGKVYEVTTLEDNTDPGSFRYAINQSGPRTVVFRVSGNIELKGNLTIKNGDITIAGQTAPGDGICLKNYPFGVEADNVIIRFIRVRVGNDVLNKPGDEYDAATGSNQNNIMIDHCTFSWANDEVASFYDNTNFTMQWCIVSESFYHSTHSKGDHGYGGIWGGMGATFHHNLLVHHSSRNPRFNGSRYHGQPQKEIVDFVNNVIYNWAGNSAYGGEEGNQNVRANYYKAGPSTGSSVLYRIVNPTMDSGTHTGYGKFFVADNFVYGYPAVTNDNWSYGVQGITSVVRDTIKKVQPFPIADVQTQSPEQAFTAVMKHAGASYPKRDALDARIIDEVKTGTAKYGFTLRGGGAGIIDSQADVGGYPVLNSMQAPQDADHDGMPDNWETVKVLNPNDPSDGNATEASGYTMLEVYLNELVAEGVTSVEDENLSNLAIPSNFVLEQNYPNPFNALTTISYSVPKYGPVDIKIYDTQGVTIRQLYSGELSAGTYKVTWDGTSPSGYSAASGVYFCLVKFSDRIKTIKLLLIR